MYATICVSVCVCATCCIACCSCMPSGVARFWLCGSSLALHKDAPKKQRLRPWPGVSQGQLMEVLQDWVTTQKMSKLLSGFQEPLGPLCLLYLLKLPTSEKPWLIFNKSNHAWQISKLIHLMEMHFPVLCHEPSLPGGI